MPTVFSHPAPVLAMGAFFAGRGLSARMLPFGVCCAVLPDADVLGRRGFSHSLAFAGLMGLAGAAFAPLLRGGRLTGFRMGLFGVASHILLDAMTNGGLGVAAFRPFDASRHFLDWRPIRVSPLGLRAFSAGAASTCCSPNCAGYGSPASRRSRASGCSGKPAADLLRHTGPTPPLPFPLQPFRTPGVFLLRKRSTPETRTHRNSLLYRRTLLQENPFG